MKALIVGVGLIGQKHIEILNTVFNIDTYSYKSSSSHKLIKQNVISVEEAIDVKFDFVVISNPTNCHVDSILELKDLNLPVFLEKPIDSSKEKLTLLEGFELKIYVAYCLRFNPVIEYVKNQIQESSPSFIFCINNNCLEAWPRANDDSYSRYHSRGGGVVMDMSHEIDYLFYIAGIEKINNFSVGKYGAYSVDAVDNLTLNCKTEHCPAMVYLNYHGHRAERKFVVDFDTYSIEGFPKEHLIKVYKKRELVEEIRFDGVYEDMYVNQWRYFIDNINSEAFIHTFDNAKKVFNILFELNLKIGE